MTRTGGILSTGEIRARSVGSRATFFVMAGLDPAIQIYGQ